MKKLLFTTRKLHKFLPLVFCFGMFQAVAEAEWLPFTDKVVDNKNCNYRFRFEESGEADGHPGEIGFGHQHFIPVTKSYVMLTKPSSPLTTTYFLRASFDWETLKGFFWGGAIKRSDYLLMANVASGGLGPVNSTRLQYDVKRKVYTAEIEYVLAPGIIDWKRATLASPYLSMEKDCAYPPKTYSSPAPL